MYIEFEAVPQFIADLAACSAGPKDTLMVLFAKQHSDCLDDRHCWFKCGCIPFKGAIFPGLIEAGGVVIAEL